MMLTMFACIVAIVWFGGNMILQGQMQTGELISFISYISQILISLMMISMVLVMVMMSRASLLRIAEVLDEEPLIKDNTQGQLEVKDGSVVFENVSFSYAQDSANLTLEDINLEFKPGETVGIIGGTGSAKTTLVQLIPRLYDVSAGRILVGGVDVRNYPLKTLRAAVAIGAAEKRLVFRHHQRQSKMGKRRGHR